MESSEFVSSPMVPEVNCSFAIHLCLYGEPTVYMLTNHDAVSSVPGPKAHVLVRHKSLFARQAPDRFAH